LLSFGGEFLKFFIGIFKFFILKFPIQPNSPPPPPPFFARYWSDFFRWSDNELTNNLESYLDDPPETDKEYKDVSALLLEAGARFRDTVGDKPENIDSKKILGLNSDLYVRACVLWSQHAGKTIFCNMFNDPSFQEFFFSERTSFARQQGTQQAQNQGLPQSLGGGTSERIVPILWQKKITAQELNDLLVGIRKACEAARTEAMQDR
ncbi:MAG: hypothetical protein ACK53X_09235, partial [Holosporales bacterium]